MSFTSAPIPFTITPTLESVLETYEISPQDYKPAYGGESAGLDLYNAGPELVIPKFQSSCLPDVSEYKRTWKTLIPTGVKIALPHNMVALLRGRGSITKTTFSLRAGVIDPGYTGEIFVNMVNMSYKDIVIEHGQKLPVQLIVVPFYSNFTLVDDDDYSKITDTAARREGKVGSSDGSTDAS